MAHHLEDNKAVVNRFIDEWNKGNLEGALALIDENVIDHNPVPNQPPGIAGARQALNAILTAFPDLKFNNDYILAEGDRVVDHGTARGTHKGTLVGIPATGQRVEFTYTDIYRIANGKIAEIWHIEDMVTAMQQIGAIKVPVGVK